MGFLYFLNKKQSSDSKFYYITFSTVKINSDWLLCCNDIANTELHPHGVKISKL